MNKKKLTLLRVMQIQLAVVIYTFSGVAGKMASGYSFLSPPFLFFYGVEICVLGIYAILWQQIIKRYDLSIAYANRSLAILWSMLWAVLFFHDTITWKNILGIGIVLCGTMMVNSDAN